jgi:hypothetical protein
MRSLLIFVAACSHDVRAVYPAPPEAPTGTLVLQLAEPASGVSVAIDGVLVVDDEHTQHIVIEHVPVGSQEVVMAANGLDKQFKVWVGDDHPTTVPLGMPDASVGFLKTLAGTLITILVYSMLHH